MTSLPLDPGFFTIQNDGPLAITPGECLALGSIALPSPPDKSGYVQMLVTLRGVSRE